MKFPVKDLLARAVAERSRRIDVAVRRTEAERIRVRQEKEKLSLAWLQFVEKIQDRIAADELPQKGDMPELLSSNITMYQQITRLEPTVYRPKTEELNGLIAMLSATEDATVSVAQIKSAGFRNVSELFAPGVGHPVPEEESGTE